VRQMVPPGPVIGLVAVLGLLAALHRRVGLGFHGWAVGVGCGLVLLALLSHGLARASRRSLLPADRVTLTRAVLVCGVAALAAADISGRDRTGASPAGILVALSSVALALDAVDGPVARRTGTVSALGARFDMETDAFLILVLSTQVSRDLGWWVVCIGAARYVLMVHDVAHRRAPRLRRQVPPRRWRKLVAAYQGIVLTVATAHVAPHVAVTAAVAFGLALLLVSFGTEVAELRSRSIRERRDTTDAYAASSLTLDDVHRTGRADEPSGMTTVAGGPA
jgi:phosphatidylglycerophosphate synthase